MKTKKLKAQKSVSQNLKFEDYKHWLAVIQLKNDINQLEKNNMDSFRENHKELKQNKTID